LTLSGGINDGSSTGALYQVLTAGNVTAGNLTWQMPTFPYAFNVSKSSTATTGSVVYTCPNIFPSSSTTSPIRTFRVRVEVTASAASSGNSSLGVTLGSQGVFNWVGTYCYVGSSTAAINGTYCSPLSIYTAANTSFPYFFDFYIHNPTYTDSKQISWTAPAYNGASLYTNTGIAFLGYSLGNVQLNFNTTNGGCTFNVSVYPWG